MFSFVKKLDLYSREEVKKLKEEFWTAFGQYMTGIASSDMEKINWVNYKTGIKHLYFRMDASNKSAIIMIELAHPDTDIRHLMYAQFEEFHHILHDALGEEWGWYPEYYDEYGKQTSRIACTLDKVSVLKKEDWPKLISFLKPRLIALDEFWSTAKYAFDIFK